MVHDEGRFTTDIDRGGICQPKKGGEFMKSKHTWEPMRLHSVGHISKVVEGGGGKLSATGGDPGEPRKEKGSGR